MNRGWWWFRYTNHLLLNFFKSEKHPAYPSPAWLNCLASTKTRSRTLRPAGLNAPLNSGTSRLLGLLNVTRKLSSESRNTAEGGSQSRTDLRGGARPRRTTATDPVLSPNRFVTVSKPFRKGWMVIWPRGYGRASGRLPPYAFYIPHTICTSLGEKSYFLYFFIPRGISLIWNQAFFLPPTDKGLLLQYYFFTTRADFN